MTKKIFNYEHEWLEARRQYITASDIAAIVKYYHEEKLEAKGLYIDSFASAFEIYHRLKGNTRNNIVDVEQQYLFEKGKACEIPMARYFINKYNNSVRIMEPIEFYIHDKFDYFGCTPDFIIDEVNEPISFPHGCITKEDGIGILECKTIIPHQYFVKYQNDEPPFQYLLQLQAQMMCTGANWGFIYTDAGYGIEEYFYCTNIGLEDIILECLERFKHDLENNIEPSPTHSKYDKDLILELTQEIDREQYQCLKNDHELNEMCKQRNEYKDKEKYYTKKSNEFNNKIRYKVKGCKETETDDYIIKIAKNNRMTIKSI